MYQQEEDDKEDDEEAGTVTVATGERKDCVGINDMEFM